MKKPEAIAILKEKYDLNLHKSNTHFSKENSAKPVWWFEIPLSKVEAGNFQIINLICERSGEVNLLQVPTKYFRDNMSGVTSHPISILPSQPI